MAAVNAFQQVENPGAEGDPLLLKPNASLRYCIGNTVALAEGLTLMSLVVI